MSKPDFDWYRTDGVVVVEEQAAVAVYRNHRDHIVIRQKGELDPENLEYVDCWIVVAPRHAAELARAIMALADEPAQLALPAPSATNAERQRRYRDRKRNGPTVKGDRNDAVTAVTDDRNATVTPILAHNGSAARR